MSTTKLVYGSKSPNGSLNRISVDPGVIPRGKTSSNLNGKDRRYIEISEYAHDKTTAGNSSATGLLGTYSTAANQLYRMRGGKTGPIQGSHALGMTTTTFTRDMQSSMNKNEIRSAQGKRMESSSSNIYNHSQTQFTRDNSPEQERPKITLNKKQSRPYSQYNTRVKPYTPFHHFRQNAADRSLNFHNVRDSTLLHFG